MSKHAASTAHSIATGQDQGEKQPKRDTKSRAADAPQKIGRFELREKVGSGAFGTVHRAFDPQLEREVALKVPRAGTLDSPKAVERFLREAKAAAQLRHPHIVPIYEAGRAGDTYYIASAFISGRTLAEAIGEGPMDFRRAAQIVRELAEALAYAHSLGIVHRDVKPANVMLDEKGQAHVMDFGLAHRHDSLEKLTHEGAILGTPAYMAPEQAVGKSGDPTPASDQYSLGVVLYELLCGDTPFSGPPEIVIFNAIHQAPVAPRTRNPNIPRDLETICLKAMAKSAKDRYPACHHLAGDLRRWLDDEPIKARRLGSVERLVRWYRREKKLVRSITLTGASLIVAIIVLSISSMRLRVSATREDELVTKEEETRSLLMQKERAVQEQTKRAESASQNATSQRQGALRESYGARIIQLTSQVEGNDFRNIVQSLDECPIEMRGWEWKRLKLLCPRTLYAGTAYAPVFDPTGNLIAATLPLGEVVVWNKKTGEKVVQVKDERRKYCVAFSPDAARIQWLSQSSVNEVKHKIRSWGIHNGTDTTALLEVPLCTSELWSPDGKLLLLERANTIELWDVESEKRLWTKDSGRTVSLLGFSADSTRVALEYLWKPLENASILDSHTGEEIRTFDFTSNPLSTGALSPDGRRFISVTKPTPTPTDGEYQKEVKVKIQSVETGEVLLQLDRQVTSGFVGPEYRCVAFSPDGGKIVAGSSDGHMRIWDSKTGAQIGRVQLQRPISYVVFTPDGKQVLSVADDVRLSDIWPTPGEAGVLTLRSGRYGALTTASSPDGRIVATHEKSTLTIRDVSLDREIYKGGRNRPPVLGNSDPLRTVISSTTVQITKRDNMISELRGHNGAVKWFDWHPDGKRIVTGSSDKTLKLWDAETGQELLTLKGHAGGVEFVEFSADGNLLVSRDAEDTFKIWLAAEAEDARLERERAEAEKQSATLSAEERSEAEAKKAQSEKDRAELSQYRRMITSARSSLDEGEVKRAQEMLEQCPTRYRHWEWVYLRRLTQKDWNALTDAEAITLDGDSGLAFSRDSRILATGRKLLDLPSGEARVFEGPAAISCAPFSPDGRMLAAGKDGEVRLWNLESGEQHFVAAHSLGKWFPVVFSPDGRCLASGSNEMVRIWDSGSGREIRTLASGRFVVFSPDSRRIAISGRGAERPALYDVATGSEALILKGARGTAKLEFSADGQRIAGAVWFDKTIKIWDAGTGEQILRIECPIFESGTVAFGMALSPDGNRIVFVKDETVKLLDAITGEEMLTLPYGPTKVDVRTGGFEAAFSPDGRWIAAGTRLWDCGARQEEWSQKN